MGRVAGRGIPETIDLVFNGQAQYGVTRRVCGAGLRFLEAIRRGNRNVTYYFYCIGRLTRHKNIWDISSVSDTSRKGVDDGP